MMQSAQATPYQPNDYSTSGYGNSSSYASQPAAESQAYSLSNGPEPSPQPYNMLASPHPGLGLWGPNASPSNRRRAPSSHPTSTGFDGSSLQFPEDSAGTTAWEGNQLKLSSSQSTTPRTLSAPPDCFAYPPAPASPWHQSKPDDAIDLDHFVAGLHGGSPSFTMNHSENIVDLRIPLTGMGDQSTEAHHHNHARHFSGSSSSVSSNGPVGENLAYEEFSSTYNTTPDPSEMPSNRDSLSLPTDSIPTSVSPSSSHQHTSPQGVMRGRQGSHGRASSTPHASLPPGTNPRFAPYPTERRRSRNWTTSAVTNPATRQWSPLVYKRPQRLAPQGSWDSPYPSPPTPPLPDHAYGYAQVAPPSQPAYPPSQAPMPSYASHPPPAPHHHGIYASATSPFDNPAPLMSHGVFRMLQSNADPISHSHYRYADLSDPPDLFASLQEKQLDPPEEDMNPSDPDMVPHEQDLRFEGDLYTPRWVRGHGNKREGWCGICKPGRWLVLKNSAFWYDKSFSHGVSAATGAQFQEPQDTRRMDGNPDVWEGLCGSCNDWVALVSSKKKGTTWFRHAYKCHTHLKVKDAPKRKRESSHSRSIATSNGSKPHTASPTPPRSVPTQYEVPPQHPQPIQQHTPQLHQQAYSHPPPPPQQQQQQQHQQQQHHQQQQPQSHQHYPHQHQAGPGVPPPPIPHHALSAMEQLGNII